MEFAKTGSVAEKQFKPIHKKKAEGTKSKYTLEDGDEDTRARERRTCDTSVQKRIDSDVRLSWYIRDGRINRYVRSNDERFKLYHCQT